MSSYFRTRLAASAVTLLLLSGPAQAQPAVDPGEIEAYFQEIQQELTGIVQTREFGRLGEWAARNVADDATLHASASLIRDGGRQGSGQVSLEKEEILRAVGMFAALLQFQDIEDHSLAVEVTDIVPHGSDAATAKVRWSESFRVDAAGLPGAARQVPDDPMLAVAAVADCRHLVERKGGQWAIGMTTCIAELRL